MRHGSGNRRQRGRNNNNRRGNGGGNNHGGGAPNRSQVFDSNGPDVRIRGTAHQIVEKYVALAKDANSAGDHTLVENYRQHAEHYQRIINVWDEKAKEVAARKAVEKEKEGASKENSPKETVSNDEDLGLPTSMLTEAPVDASKEKEAETA